MGWLRAIAMASAIGALAAACASAGPGDGSGGRGVAPHALDGRSFVSTRVLERGLERPLVPGTRIELSFSQGRVSARAGCNLMGAPYRLQGGRLRLVGDVSMTEMGCDPERHEQDAWLSAFLGSSPRVRLEGTRLTLAAEGTVIELVDLEVAEPDLPLQGTRWRLGTIVDGEVAATVPGGLRAWLRFPDERTVEVFTGCRKWTGSVERSGEVLAIGHLAFRAEALCTARAVALEQDVMAVLGGGRIAYEIDGPTLILRAGDRELHWRGGPEPTA